MHTLNSGATLVWFLCDGTRDLADIATEISTTFDLPKEEVMPQVQESVAQFQSLGLLES